MEVIATLLVALAIWLGLSWVARAIEDATTAIRFAASKPPEEPPTTGVPSRKKHPRPTPLQRAQMPSGWRVIRCAADLPPAPDIKETATLT